MTGEQIEPEPAERSLKVEEQIDARISTLRDVANRVRPRLRRHRALRHSTLGAPSVESRSIETCRLAGGCWLIYCLGRVY